MKAAEVSLPSSEAASYRITSSDLDVSRAWYGSSCLSTLSPQWNVGYRVIITNSDISTVSFKVVSQQPPFKWWNLPFVQEGLDDDDDDVIPAVSKAMSVNLYKPGRLKGPVDSHIPLVIFSTSLDCATQHTLNACVDPDGFCISIPEFKSEWTQMIFCQQM